jgi:predicted RNA-binding Zn-ribbon protein involved in translation (DUF1610 family)
MKSKTKVCPECGCEDVESIGSSKMLTAAVASLGGAGGFFAGQAGAGSGVALGAGLGSFVPGIGTAIGAVSGGLVGSVIGLLTGAGVGSIAGKELERKMKVFKCNECGMIFKS